MTHFTVSAAGPNARDLPCRLRADAGRCGRPVRYVVDEYDLDETPHRHVRQFGACDDHADLYR